MGRRYNVTFFEQSISVVQDLLQIKGATGRCLRILRQWLEIDDSTLPAAQFVGLRSRTLLATVTDGTGGAAATIDPADPGDPAATFTALRNNVTTKATTSSSAKLHYNGGFYVYTGHERMYSSPPVIMLGESFVFEVVRAPSAAIIMSGGVEVEELGG